MSNPQHIHLALKAFAPSGRTFYDDQAPGSPTAPWIVGGLQMPDAIESLAGRRVAGTAVWRVTVSAETAASARVIAWDCERAWSGRRVAVPGWVLGSVRPPRTRGPYPAGLTATDTNLRFQVVAMEFDLTVSEIPGSP